MKKRIIGVDLRCLPMDGSKGAGVEHAARELWEVMYQEREKYSVELVGFVAKGAWMESEEGIVRLQNDSGGELRRVLREMKENIDALFVPSGAVTWGIEVPTYPWVHDLVIFDHPEWFPQAWWKRELTTRLYLRGLHRSKHVFTVSEDTSKAIQKIAGVDSMKITVTYQGSSERNAQTTSESLVQGEYALILGTVEPRKNIPFIISLWPEVERRLGRSVQLVIAGRDGWGNVAIPDSPSIKRIRLFDDEQRDAFIRDASLLLLPSLHEGFGRLALEAMQEGTALIASDRGSLQEVVGSGGQTLSLDRPEAWIEAIVTILSYESEKARWQAQGRSQAAKFRWEKVASTILAKLSRS